MTQTAVDPRATVLDRIKELPPLPVVVHELIAVMRDAECCGEEVNRILSSDQALASKVLRLVNSSFYGLPGRVSTVPRAVVILGHAAIRNLATGLAVAGALGGKLPPHRRSEFWSHALATAAGAEVIGRRAGLPDPQEAFIAGLLHDIGHLILMMALPDEHAFVAAEGRLGDVDRERQVIGLDHCRAGRQLLQHWKLPAPLLECVRLHHAPEACHGGSTPLLTTVALADRLARVTGASGEGVLADDDVTTLAAALGLDAASTLALVPDVEARVVEARSFLKLAEIETAPAAQVVDMPVRAVVVSGDAARRDWLDLLARHHGLETCELRDWLAAGADGAGTVILWDAATIDAQQSVRLLPHVTDSGATVRRLGAPDGSAGRDAPLALTFSQGELRSGND